jgi:cation-transporting ATPase I
MLVELLRGSPLTQALAPAVSMAVAAVPEGLPFVATVAELASAKRLSTRNTLVRNPSTIEALGRVDVLCFDKTGTLTEGHISLRLVSDGQIEQEVEEAAPELRAIVGAALRAGPRFGGGRAIPHPTDRAIVDGAERLGITPQEGLRTWHRVAELPFEPARGYHAVLGRGESGQLLSVKGAPEVVLGQSTNVVVNGQVVPLDLAIRRRLEQEVDRLALRGYRVLAVAERPASSRADLDESRIESLCFLGFLGLADPVRPTAKRSVERLVRAGVQVVMITGDHPSTAEAIAAEIGALDGRRVMTGPELEELDDEVLAKALPDVAVFARVTPEHKARPSPATAPTTCPRSGSPTWACPWARTPLPPPRPPPTSSCSTTASRRSSRRSSRDGACGPPSATRWASCSAAMSGRSLSRSDRACSPAAPR